ncbi:hypothetical protein CASFOL_011480 [Castilleja foliolosa]|uniref:PI-PLC X domain-containing protein At5g67130-like n=1 Tax=Castilleja foliolosa TaxID=1961234 RepID=A0ABD3DZK1_9LAMI
MKTCKIRHPIGRLFFMLLSLFFFFFIPTTTACSIGGCQLLDSCSTATDCGPGLYCGNCPSLDKAQPFCVRGQATIPTSIISGLPFNKYSWLVTHNAFSIVDEPSMTGAQRITFYNQEDSVTNQLRNGVRGLMLDMYDFENDIWLCHSLRGQCYNFTAFEPAINTLREVEAFLTQNPSEIVTIIIEDYVHSPKGLTKVFADAGLNKYWYPVAKMPKKGEDWPIINNMVQNNHRLLVFTSDSSKESSEGIAYQWRYMVENESGDPGVVPNSCPNRKESKPLTSKVNFYMRSDGGGVFDDLDHMNGHTLCGCTTVSACQAGAPFGSCKAVAASNTTPSNVTTSGSFSGSVQLAGDASPINIPAGILLVSCLLTFLVNLFLL